MLSTELDGALHALGAALATNPALEAELVARWLPRVVARPKLGELPAELVTACNRLLAEIPAITQSPAGVTALAPLFADVRGIPLLAFCAASTARRNVRIAPLLVAASREPVLAERAVAVARDRVVQGPLLDALSSAPLLGD